MEQEEIRKDLDYFLQKVEQSHPNPFLHITKSNFEQKLRKISEDLIELPVLGLKLQQLISQIQDSHTQISLNKKILGNECYPLRFKSFADGTYLIKSNSENQKFLGMKLKRINQRPLNKIKKLLEAIIPNENSVSYGYYFVRFLHEPEILCYLNIVKFPSSAVYELEDKQGKTYILSTEPKSINTELLEIKDDIKISEDTLYEKEIYWTKYIESTHTYYLQYNSCELRDEFPIEKIVEEIRNQAIEKLVVDLRNNKGGDSDVLQPLLKYLNNQDNKYPLFIITSSDTFSSAVINAIELSKIKNCTIVGDIPHGSPTHFGEVVHFTLPSSKLDFQSSTQLFEYQPYSLGETLKIDIFLPETFEEYYSGVDKQMRYIENLLP